MKDILRNQKGVALMMILTAIIILTAIYTQFTFDSKISRIKATNILDRTQSKLLAEAGLQLAMTRLRLYKEAFNKLEANADAKKMVKPELLNQLWEVPFIYPIPAGKDASAAFKNTVEKFEKESILDGQMKVSIQNISNRLNVNLMRIDVTKIQVDQEGNVVQPDTSSLLDDSGRTDDVSIDLALFQLLKRLVDEKKEVDEAFADRNSNLNYQELFTNLKYYMSDFQTMNQDPLAGEAEATFQKIPMTPKYGPLTSSSELYSIPGWRDELVDLIKNEFSVYPNLQLDLNKVTANMLKMMFPNLQPDQIDAFFKWRDEPEDPKTVNSTGDLKRYFVDEGVMAEADFNARIEAFQKSGITFGANPNMFKIVSEGEFNRSVYTLVAYVVLPPQEQAKPAQQTAGAQGGAEGGTQGGVQGATQGGAQGGTNGGEAAKPITQLLEPRIIEIQVN